MKILNLFIPRQRFFFIQKEPAQDKLDAATEGLLFSPRQIYYNSFSDIFVIYFWIGDKVGPVNNLRYVCE